MTNILMLDAAGTPQEWITAQDAALYVTKNLVAWSLGDTCRVLRGGHNAKSGQQSTLELAPIIAVKGPVYNSRTFRPLTCTRQALFRRDHYLCAYCGQAYKETELTADHVLPQSRGGPWSFANLVSACKSCNNLKADRLPEEARMPLLYVPYTPNRYESFLLSGRNVLACQMAFLRAGVSANSRHRLQ